MTNARAAGARDDDWQALARVAAGDLDAFAPLVERHQARLLTLCGRMLGDPEAARDATQEVLLKLFRRAGDLTPRGQLFTWLYRVGVNHCLNRLRRRRLTQLLRGGGRAAGEPEPPEPPTPGADPEVALAAREAWRATRAALGRLPPGQRAVVVLARFEGLPQREIARLLGISEGAVESRLVRAMRTLGGAQESAAPGVPGKGAAG